MHVDRKPTGGCQEEKIKSEFFKGTRFPCGVMKIFWNQIGGMAEQDCECTTCHSIVHLKMVNFLM